MCCAFGFYFRIYICFSSPFRWLQNGLEDLWGRILTIRHDLLVRATASLLFFSYFHSLSRFYVVCCASACQCLLFYYPLCITGLGNRFKQVWKGILLYWRGRCVNVQIWLCCYISVVLIRKRKHKKIPLHQSVQWRDILYVQYIFDTFRLNVSFELDK